MNAGGCKLSASLGGIGSIGAILGGYLPGIMTDAKSLAPFLAISMGGIVLFAIILVPLWRVKPPTSWSNRKPGAKTP
jgi:branched-subunit amino acid ABC-type transport system permease component